MTMKKATLEGLFLDTLKDVYYAERKILKALPKMARSARTPELRSAFEKHKAETETHVERLQQVFELIGAREQGKTCPAIDGIIEEGEEIIEGFKGEPAMDAGLLAAAQAVEHYEMARYRSLKSWATLLGQKEAADLLNQTLSEETATDKALAALADGSVNGTALEAA
jgi:ferritin-like metal-binding protein YciE